MPTLEVPIEHEEISVLEAVGRLAEPSSDESRSTLKLFDGFIQQAFRTSEFLQIQSQYTQLRGSLAAYSTLSDDWNSYGADRPSAHTIGLTLRLLNNLRRELFLPVHLIPSAEGGVAAYFKAGDRVSYLEYRNSGEVILAMYDRDSEPDIRELTENDADESRAIALIREYITA
jgi:hypothetical protein